MTPDFYTPIARHLYYPLIDLYKHAPVQRRLFEAERNQYLPPEQLQALQLERLQSIITHAQKAPLYAERFAGLNARDMRSVDALRHVPLLSKQDVLTERVRLHTGAPAGRVFSASTSGSTGMAMQFSVDSEHHAWVEACQLRGRRWWGLERGARQLLLWSRPVDPAGYVRLRAWLKYRLRNYLQFDTFEDFDQAKLEYIVNQMRLFRPKLIYGYGSSIGKLASHIREAGAALRGADRPILVEFTADHLYASEQSIVKEVISDNVVPAYGASEVGGVAQQCRAGRLHISTDHCVVEILRPDGTAAPSGETGEIVLTSLHNRAMPFIRYRVGDLGSLEDGICDCGVTLPMMTLSAGKAVDLISTSTRKAVSAHVLDYINIYLMRSNIRGVRQYFVEQLGEDSFCLAIVRDSVFEQRCVEVFVERMRAYLGDQISVDVTFVDEIPLLPSGKRRYFKNSFRA